MKLIKVIILSVLFLPFTNCKGNEKSESQESAIAESIEQENVNVIPITHGTLVLDTALSTIYVDPTGGSDAFKGQKEPDVVLITDIHGDHLSVSTLEELSLTNATVIAPKAVADKIPSTVLNDVQILNNGEEIEIDGLLIEAIPMYNLREEALQFHTKGRGNGYVLTINDERIYISGDTEDIPEMRNLKDIDRAFVCMNLPYTMPVDKAASAVLDFKPKRVYPYHYRGKDGLSDIAHFKNLVEKEDDTIEIVMLDWY